MLQKKSNGNETAKYIRIAVLLIYDILAVFLAEIISIWTRFEFSLKNEQCIPYLETAVRYFWINVCVTLVIFAIMHLYNSLWKYASVQELLNVVVAVCSVQHCKVWECICCNGICRVPITSCISSFYWH